MTSSETTETVRPADPAAAVRPAAPSIDERPFDRTVFRFILRYSKPQQLWILFITCVSFPFLYYSLDLPKTIINEAIQGSGFPKDIYGYTLTQTDYLFVLCGLFLILVLINGAFKYYINVYKGRLGERMLRRLRYDLYARVLRFPLPHFRRTSQGEIIPMITSEVETLSGFIGDAFVQPLWQAGQLLVPIAFIFMQDPVLGIAATALYPFQGWLIPRLQKKVNQLGKRRVRTIRALADRIGESVSGVTEIHAHDGSARHLADFSYRLGDIYDIRYEIYQRKFFIKFLNNFINQLTPFFFYSIGGYLVITGGLNIGALVAVLSAYKDMAGPWKELLDYYQIKEDMRIKYGQVVEQFAPTQILPAAIQYGEDTLEGPLPRQLVFSNVSISDDGGPPALDQISTAIDLDRPVAVVGGRGREEVLMLAARLILPTSGRVRLGSYDLAELAEATIGRRIAYVGSMSYVFSDTLRANIAYGIAHRPVIEPAWDDQKAAWWARRVREAELAGNVTYNPAADWLDYRAAGVDGPKALEARMVEILKLVGLGDDVYRLGLAGTCDPAASPEFAEAVLNARRRTRTRLEDPGLAELVEPFDPDAFNTSASIAENLLFGTPVGPVFQVDALPTQPFVRKVLDEVGLTAELERIGVDVAETMIELFQDLPPGHEFFEQFSFISSEDLPEFQPLVQRARKDGMDALAPDDRARLMELPFKLIEGRHRLGVIDDALRDRILEARRLFARSLPADLAPHIAFFDADRYNPVATIQDNILFGKIRHGASAAGDRVQVLISDVIDELGLRASVMSVGLDFHVGVAGSRLSNAQRQKVGLTRALLKRPEILILNEATASLDGHTQADVHRHIMETYSGGGLIWGVHRASLAKSCGTVYVFDDGRLVEHGRPEDLEKKDGHFAHFLKAE